MYPKGRAPTYRYICSIQLPVQFFVNLVGCRLDQSEPQVVLSHPDQVSSENHLYVRSNTIKLTRSSPHLNVFASAFGFTLIYECTQNKCGGYDSRIPASTFSSPVLQRTAMPTLPIID
ncbi:hypothetical protein SNOG_08585 [Parastagonospora nodorum SN15]|uniref:Uncharacterized protein n=1 Tax=Phaeosphaeria nodorum (strain SN15 / ATCC MYA-4574 / FGSC 10173) TaxID=321614 RepID=Q0UI29_PHANO|nr:hypothetical protein SNOG_08585 [Parastagonospora nodorum SN15]EAT83753.1 hypothetical protein SNOG_08585 [Parastagonospora nodorum SN15]